MTMRTVLISGSDTGVGKTRVVGLLARWLGARGTDVSIVKPVETGRAHGELGDAAEAARAAGLPADAARTLRVFAAPLAPLAAAEAEGALLEWSALVAGVVDAGAGGAEGDGCLLVEGAGGIAVPLASDGRDWADFAQAIRADAVVLVVADRLGAINQARLALAYARSRGLRAGVWLNATAPVDAAVAASNRAGLRAAGVEIWGESGFGADGAESVAGALAGQGTELRGRETLAGDTVAGEGSRPLAAGGGGHTFHTWGEVLVAREAAGLRRRVRVHTTDARTLNLAGNDYLGLARDPAVVAAMIEAACTHGASASASSLITGWGAEHAAAVDALTAWHGFAEGLLWSSGFAANAGVLGTLPRAGDLVLADRLIHHSMVAGILKSGARLRRYAHLDLDALERLLEQESGAARTVFVATESVFSMDGDYPDLRRIAALRRRFGFCWILDEAHALGWYGTNGAGLAEEQGVAAEVDVLVGTGGKALGAGGGYTLFHGGPWREVLVNFAGEFIYSTGLPPPVAAALRAATGRARELAVTEQARWRAESRVFRARLRAAGWAAADGDSPIVAVTLGAPERAVRLAERLRAAGVLAAAVRPPTVPTGTSRLRFSLTRNFGEADATRVLAALGVADAKGGAS